MYAWHHNLFSRTRVKNESESPFYCNSSWDRNIVQRVVHTPLHQLIWNYGSFQNKQFLQVYSHSESLGQASTSAQCNLGLCSSLMCVKYLRKTTCIMVKTVSSALASAVQSWSSLSINIYLSNAVELRYLELAYFELLLTLKWKSGPSFNMKLWQQVTK